MLIGTESVRILHVKSGFAVFWCERRTSDSGSGNGWKPEGMVVDGSTRSTRLMDSAHPTSYYIQSDCARLLGKGLDKFAVNRLSFVGFLQADISKGAPRETYISASQS